MTIAIPTPEDTPVLELDDEAQGLPALIGTIAEQLRADWAPGEHRVLTAKYPVREALARWAWGRVKEHLVRKGWPLHSEFRFEGGYLQWTTCRPDPKPYKVP